ncbi:MAG: hypothetical protein ABI885_06610 [Gammaproteobacteria bacterium]
MKEQASRDASASPPIGARPRPTATLSHPVHNVWLVELISPFATPANKISEAMLLDLAQGPFRETPFNLHRTDPATGRRDRVRLSSHIKTGGHA